MRTDTLQHPHLAWLSVPLPTLDMHRVEEALRTNHTIFGGTPLTQGQIASSIKEYLEFWQRHKQAGAPDLFEKPSLAVDRVWHTHMCETEQYMQDCQAYFGKMFHHSNRLCDLHPDA